ncbi:MAG: TolB protein [Alphaproteobacteria bacterium]|nr:TolB protein [Alphaproteobacteria bacterium]
MEQPRRDALQLCRIDKRATLRLRQDRPTRGKPMKGKDKAMPRNSAAGWKPASRSLVPLLAALAFILVSGRTAAAQLGDGVLAGDGPDRELPLRRIAYIGNAAEFYFSPDGRSIIGNAKRDDDAAWHVYTMNIDGTGIRRINDRGEDACSYYFPDGKRIIWTSTRDHPELPKGNYSDPADYPQGAELYTSNPDGSDVRRLTSNSVYDAEVSVSPDGQWVLFGRQTDGKMDLWRMRPDGAEPRQVTHMEGWEPGGAFYLPDNRTIIFRAWRTADRGKRGLPMSIFTVRDDGTELRRVTDDGGTNWSPFPAPDGRHFVFVKVLPPRNYEIYLGDLQSPRQVRLTSNDGFDGFPAISPDGSSLLFTSSRDAPPGERFLTLYLMDISSLNIGKPGNP